MPIKTKMSVYSTYKKLKKIKKEINKKLNFPMHYDQKLS